METSVKQRLIEFMQEENIPTRTFERACGFANGYIKSLRETPSLDRISKIIDTYPQLNRTWLLTGDGNMLKSAQPSAQTAEHTDVKALVKLPVDVSELLSRLFGMMREKDAIIMRQAETIGALKHKIKVLSDSGDNK